jgi:hypothetical protein
MALVVRRAVHRLLTIQGAGARSAPASAIGGARLFASSRDDAESPAGAPSSTAFEPKVDTWAERRRAWKRELDARRVEWAAEFKARDEARAEEERLERARVEAEKAERRKVKDVQKAKTAQRVARQEGQRLRAKEATLRRKAVLRAQKEFVAHLRKTAREEELLKASRNWVRREHLDERIEEALADPKRMW